jgi:hypothetical protein
MRRNGKSVVLCGLFWVLCGCGDPVAVEQSVEVKQTLAQRAGCAVV